MDHIIRYNLWDTYQKYITIHDDTCIFFEGILDQIRGVSRPCPVRTCGERGVREIWAKVPGGSFGVVLGRINEPMMCLVW